MNPIGKTLIFIGSLLVLAGVVVLWIGKIPFLGRLPGDIRMEKEHVSFYFPLTTSLLISILLSLALWLFGKK